MPDLRGQAGRVVLDCPQPAGWSTGVDAKTADVSEAGHEATGSGEGISLGLPTWAFKNKKHGSLSTALPIPTTVCFLLI